MTQYIIPRLLAVILLLSFSFSSAANKTAVPFLFDFILDDLESASITSTSIPPLSIDGAYTISWSGVEGMTIYTLEVQTSDGGEWLQVYSGSDTAFQIAAQADGQYFYRVQACSSSECSAYLELDAIKVGIDAPENVLATRQDGEYSLNWDHVNGAEYYQIEINENNLGWTALSTTAALTQNSFSHTPENSLVAFYRVKACANASSGEVCSVWSENSNTVGLIAPASISAVKNGVAIDLSWTPVVGNSRYELEMREGNSSWQNVTDSHYRPYIGGDYDYRNTTYPKTRFDSQPQGSRQFRVAACNDEGCTEFSPASEVITFADGPERPQAPVAQKIENTITLAWLPVSGATNYHVEISTNLAQWYNITGVIEFDPGNPTEISLVYSAATGLRVFRIIACNEIACSPVSPDSNWIDGSNIFRRVPKVPGQPRALIYGDTVTVTWEGSPGADAYHIEAKYGDADWQNITAIAGSGDQTQFSLVGSYAEDSFYRVSACYDGNCSDYSDVSARATRVPDIPETPAILVDGLKVTLNWLAVADAESYLVQRNLNDGGWLPLAQSSDISFTDTLTDSASVSYRLKACAGSGDDMVCSEASLETKIMVTKTPAVPETPTLLVNKSAVSLSWSPVTDAMSYQIQRKIDAADWVELPLISNTSFSETLSGFGTVSYRLLACVGVNEAKVCSEPSVQVSAEFVQDTVIIINTKLLGVPVRQ
ncbi:hypothetical protein [Thalassomonas sp. RHCl1]|uniref:hypothetical protein n=1 Tax=Thalassomonas sp. RHCl1 TaxID=2995320 RepID=UPI00248D1349|nr:hypothetical protein [Thalassomonas sp. RHCl1]